MSDNKKNYDVLEFSNQAKLFIEKYFKIGLALAVVGIACSAAWVGMTKMETQKEQESFTALFAITDEYNTLKEGFEKAKAPKDPKAQKEKKEESKTASEEPVKKATGDIDKDYGEVVQKLENFLKSQKGMQASGEAALVLSEIYEDHGKKEQAANVVSQTLQSWKGEGRLLGQIMQMRAGDLWSMNNQCDKAVTHWEKLANRESFLSSQAQLKLGLCYQKLGKIDLARTWLQKVTSKNAESPAGFSAKKYLRYLDFEKNLKKEKAAGKTADEEKNKQEKAS